MTIDIQQSVGSIVANQLSRARVFEWFDIDYCCHGGAILADVCRERNLDPSKMVEELERSDRQLDRAPSRDWSAASIPQLIDNITSEHHTYLKAELPRLTQLMRKIASVHGERHPNLLESEKLFTRLRDDLEAHLAREEEILFPPLRAAEIILDTTLRNELAGVEDDHQVVGDCLAQLKALNDGYQMPADGCTTYAATMHGLMTLELDIHIHIHKENNLLFPKVRAIAA